MIEWFRNLPWGIKIMLGIGTFFILCAMICCSNFILDDSPATVEIHDSAETSVIDVKSTTKPTTKPKETKEELETPEPIETPEPTEELETSKKLTADVKLVSANKTLNNTHVGHEWSYSVKVNNKEINLGETISVSGTINAQATVVENDNAPDKGTNSKNLVAGKNVIKVTVIENRGRYSGESEVWEFVLNVQYK
jgi:hypothetical protein